ncbi:wsv483 [White spot syndrome virus]|uniref:Wsv483 n=5 Tax=White spot syndrome virus TaxID=342409 RepID=Q8VAE2_WSSVS|nr:wsv483 [Shrimp white spot syndrome virus]AFX59857.1 wsv483 [White spot syndrome virus]AAL33484.1 wsv483 [Shrimp white spot syndrome virus]AAL88878.1 WSSV010 [Shrimp white spot syndrome virus]ASV62797.1 hypothetical protein [White spot syndrome virus]AWQ62706.1 wsv483 [Shrimp white spot syndrome virus]
MWRSCISNIREMGDNKDYETRLIQRINDLESEIENKTELCEKINEQMKNTQLKYDKCFVEEETEKFRKMEERVKYLKEQGIPLDPEERRTMLAEIDKSNKELDALLEENERIIKLIDEELESMK